MRSGERARGCLLTSGELRNVGDGDPDACACEDTGEPGCEGWKAGLAVPEVVVDRAYCARFWAQDRVQQAARPA